MIKILIEANGNILGEKFRKTKENLLMTDPSKSPTKS